jgi:hypothetical protein
VASETPAVKPYLSVEMSALDDDILG